ncbi:hypothetical protein C8R44DRAFT_883851 [Mycena epipterygia]|nr:hypothetical protein C8R44DRAFT_883851 [Mycena epipterygia]
MSLSLWNFTFDDTSPFLTYTPYANGSYSGPANGWVPWYSGSGFISKNGDGGSGDSFHLTSLDGASVNLQFHGTAVYLYGTTNSSYQIMLDNISSFHVPPTSDLLLSLTGLAEGTHSVTLTARPTSSSQQLAFDRAVISTPQVNNTTPAELFYDNTDTSMLKYSGKWSAANVGGIPNASVSHPWQETYHAGASVAMNIGIGAVGVSLWGLVDWGNWLYNVSIDGAESTHNGSTFWEVPDALLFYQGGLDPTTNHTVVLTDVSQQMKLALNSIRIYSIESAKNATSSGITGANHKREKGDSKKKKKKAPDATKSSTLAAYFAVPTGVIAGAIIAVVVLALLCGFFWWRSRRNRSGPSLPSHHNALNDLPPHRPLFPPRGYSDAMPITPFLSSGPSATYPAPGTKLGTSMARGSAPYHDDDRNGGTHTVGPTIPPVDGNSDIDRLIELIVQRIDRGRHAEAAPPEYSG